MITLRGRWLLRQFGWKNYGGPVRATLGFWVDSWRREHRK